MLNQFRNKKIHFFSTFLIVFAILVKMLVPIAHASNASTGSSKSFLASLCSGNKIVLVSFSLPGDSEPAPSTAIASNKCPLCFIAEQDGPSNDITQTLFYTLKAVNVFNTFYNTSVVNSAPTLRAIRAPPTTS